jgi:hypothetical protein
MWSNVSQILISFKSATIQMLYNASSAEATSGRLQLMVMKKRALKDNNTDFYG